MNWNEFYTKLARGSYLQVKIDYAKTAISLTSASHCQARVITLLCIDNASVCGRDFDAT